MTDSSLILSDDDGDESAAPFFPGMENEALEEMERDGEFTGERLFKRFPQKYKFIVSLLAEGTISIARIAKTCQVSRNTVAAVMKREQIPIEQIKDRIRMNIRQGLVLTTERLLELVPEMSPKDLIIAAGVLTDKLAVLSGEATVIVEHKGDKLQHASFNDMLDGLPAADAHVIEAAPGMGSPGGMLGQKGEPLRLAGGAAEPIDISHSDTESLVSPRENPASNAFSNGMEDKAGPPNNDEPLAPGDDQGGRGSDLGEGGINPNSL